MITETFFFQNTFFIFKRAVLLVTTPFVITLLISSPSCYFLFFFLTLSDSDKNFTKKNFTRFKNYRTRFFFLYFFLRNFIFPCKHNFFNSNEYTKSLIIDRLGFLKKNYLVHEDLTLLTIRETQQQTRTSLQIRDLQTNEKRS